MAIYRVIIHESIQLLRKSAPLEQGKFGQGYAKLEDANKGEHRNNTHYRKDFFL